MEPVIECFEDEIDPEVRRGIAEAIERYNDERTGLGAPSRRLALAVRDPQTGGVVGGLWAVSYYGWLFVELLALPEAYRGHGLGTRLMRQAEAVARGRGCIGVWLDTFSFQARGFYEKLGYRVFGTIAEYPPGESRYFLQKTL